MQRLDLHTFNFASNIAGETIHVGCALQVSSVIFTLTFIPKCRPILYNLELECFQITLNYIFTVQKRLKSKNYLLYFFKLLHYCL